MSQIKDGDIKACRFRTKDGRRAIALHASKKIVAHHVDRGSKDSLSVTFFVDNGGLKEAGMVRYDTIVKESIEDIS